MATLRDKREFIYKYASYFDVISGVEWYPHPKRLIDEVTHTHIRHIASRARIELGYSVNYGDVDIVWHLQGKYNEMKELQLFTN